MLHMRREKEIGKSFLSGTKGGIIFISGSLASIALFFIMARCVDFVVKKSETDAPRTILPFTETQSPSVPSGGSAGDSSLDDSSLKLNFYTALLQNNEDVAHTTLLNKKTESKSPQAKPLTNTAAQEQQAAPADKNTTAQRPVSPQAFFLQMGAYQKTAKAQSVVAVLRSAGYHPYTDNITVPGKGTLVRVRIGPFQDLSIARNKAAEIEKKTKLPVGITRQ